MSETQKTIKKEFSLSGIGLHTGHPVKMVFKPAAENSGIAFIRVDLPNRPLLKADISNIFADSKVPRCTSIGQGREVIHTVEHLMSVLCGLGVDNLTIEINGNELPGLDGSGIDFLKAIKEAGLSGQSASRQYYEVKEPLGIEHDGSCVFITPAADFKVSYTLDYPHPFLKTQFFSTLLDQNIFEKEVAPCRTFCLEQEALNLKNMGLGKGANYENTLVVGDTGVIKNQLRFPDEFVRHKVLDLIGDLYLLGKPIRGHVFALKSGHTLNLALLKKVQEQKEKCEAKTYQLQYPPAGQKEIDIQGIMKILPHRFPFLLVDKIIELEKGKKAVGIKNVTINDNFFQGHFPSRPVMPGVLIIEALAQTAGVAVLTNEEHHGKVAFFMAIDKVKFRKVVTPGDQLFLEIEILRDRAKTTQIRAVAKVDGEIAAEAEMMFSFTDAAYLD